MKKLLTSVLTLALVLCCFTFVGCTKDEDNDPKPATIEQTLAICDQFIADMQAIQTKISAPDYEYPTTDAVESSTPVRATDKSSIGIEYSNYMDFDYTYDFFENSTLGGETYTSSDCYLLIMYMSQYLDEKLDIYKGNNLDLNNVYKYNTEDNGYSATNYLKLINNNSKICLYFYQDTQYSYLYELTISLDDNKGWKSFEYKGFDQNNELLEFGYCEKSTNVSRVFDRGVVTYIETVKGIDEIYLTDINETTQKMIYIDGFSTDSMNVIQSQAYSYFETLNIENIADSIDITNAVEIEVNLGE